MKKEFFEACQFEVKNLGGIKEGKFQVKPLTIFCGPNNSGKTWTTYSLYCALRPDHIYSNALRLTEKSNISIEEWLKKFSNKFIREVNRGMHLELPDLFRGNIKNFKKTEFNRIPNQEQFIKLVTNNFSKQNIQETTLPLHFTRQRRRERWERYTKLLGQDSSTNVFLMPAERNGLHLFYKELSNKRTALLHHASKKNIDLAALLKDVIESRYATPIADYIDWLNELSENKKKVIGSFHPIATKILKEITQGRYRISSTNNEIFFHPYQKKRDGQSIQEMGLHMTASTVKSMFGLWFFLEYQAKKGDILMIDEPELNMHPTNQRIIARILAHLVNQGIYVIVSTHSDYFIREINSLIMLSDKDATPLLKEHQYQKEEVLTPEQVGAYLFDNQTIEPFTITKEDGVHATTLDDVIKDHNQTNDDIYYSLQEIKEKQNAKQ